MLRFTDTSRSAGRAAEVARRSPELSVANRTLTRMTMLSTVPEWVRPPPQTVMRMEDFLLRLYGRTKSPETLGAWACLDWLAGRGGEQSRGPLTRHGFPTAAAARGDMHVADAIAEGEPYPGPRWWAACGITSADQMSTAEWTDRIVSPYERAYCHGVRVAFGWLLGVIHDAGHLAPVLDGKGAPIPPADRDAYARYLRELVLPSAGSPAASRPGRTVPTC